jgi:hypothetical protein
MRDDRSRPGTNDGIHPSQLSTSRGINTRRRALAAGEPLSSDTLHIMHYCLQELGQLAGWLGRQGHIINYSPDALDQYFQYRPWGFAPRTILKNIALVQPVHTVSIFPSIALGASPLWQHWKILLVTHMSMYAHWLIAHCTALHCTALHSTALHCTALHCSLCQG